MAAPTRTMIEADVTLPTFKVEVYNGSSWVDVTADVVSCNVIHITPPLLEFNASSGASARIELTDARLTLNVARSPVRVSFGFSTSDKVQSFVGLITQRDRRYDGVVWTCRGYEALIETSDVDIALQFNRPTSTETTASSIEDPDDSGYAGGMVNEIFWKSGGRPYEQAGSYPSAVFYYSCEPSLVDVYATWLNSESAWEDLGRLCRACGGQVAQDERGIVRYRSPLGMVSGAATYSYTDAALTQAQRVSTNTSNYETIEESANYDRVLDGIAIDYVRRGLSGGQVIYEDDEFRILEPSATITINVQTDNPAWSLNVITVNAAVMRTGRKVEPTISNRTRVGSKISFDVTNPTAQRVGIYGLRIRGQSLITIEEGEELYQTTGNIATARTLRSTDNAYIQTKKQATQIARMFWEYLSEIRPSIRLIGAGYDPERTIGEFINLTNSSLGYSNTRCVIGDIDITDGATMSLTLIDVSQFDQTSAYFIIGTSYSASDTRKVGY
jgi:hypothetical protein